MFKPFSCNNIMKTKYLSPINLLLQYYIVQIKLQNYKRNQFLSKLYLIGRLVKIRYLIIVL